MHDDKNMGKSTVNSLPLERLIANLTPFDVRSMGCISCETECAEYPAQTSPAVHFVELLERPQLVENSFVALREAMKPSGPHRITTGQAA